MSTGLEFDAAVALREHNARLAGQIAAAYAAAYAKVMAGRARRFYRAGFRQVTRLSASARIMRK